MAQINQKIDDASAAKEGIEDNKLRLRRKMKKLNGLLAENRCLYETVLSKQNAVNFFRSHLEKVQRENDDLRLQIRRPQRAIEQRG